MLFAPARWRKSRKKLQASILGWGYYKIFHCGSIHNVSSWEGCPRVEGPNRQIHGVMSTIRFLCMMFSSCILDSVTQAIAGTQWETYGPLLLFTTMLPLFFYANVRIFLVVKVSYNYFPDIPKTQAQLFFLQAMSGEEEREGEARVLSPRCLVVSRRI